MSAQEIRPHVRSMRVLVATALVIALSAVSGGCNVTSKRAPAGLLGWKWGDDAAECAREAALTSVTWSPWTDPAFEVGMDLDHPLAVLGAEGVVRLVRADAKQLEGVQVVYRSCARDDAMKSRLREGLHRELHVESTDVDVPYQRWSDGSLVHLVTDPRDNTCTLTVAGPRFGKVFASALLREGIGNLGSSMTPR